MRRRAVISMNSAIQGPLVVGVCDFGWGSLGKLRLILDHLPATDVALYGDAGINRIAADLLSTRHRLIDQPPERAPVALVINDPTAAHAIADLGVPVIYVDSLPYMWARPEEVPAPGKVALYCAQRFPADRLPVSKPLRKRRDLEWIDPIVPASKHRQGGEGVVISVGGLHSHLVGNTAEAYLNLVLFPLVEMLADSGSLVSAVCGNLTIDACRELAARLPDGCTIGRQSPYEFERLLRGADLLITSPGSTTILQAVALRLPTFLLPPQNLSQILNARLYSSLDESVLFWPPSVMTLDRIEELRPEGEDIVLSYIYGSISAAAASPEARSDVEAILREEFASMPEEGVLDPFLPSLGSSGAKQVAQRIRQALLAPIPPPAVGGPASDA